MIHKSSLIDSFSSLCAHGFFEMCDEDGAPQNAAFIQDEAFEDVSQRRTGMITSLGLPPQPVMSLKQIHSDTVVCISENWERGEAPQADGFVTRTPGIVLGILTADCGPVLFVDPVNHVTGACHAGWKGAMSGVMENTLAAMEDLGAQKSEIRAALGPTIQQPAYEVGPEFPLKALTVPYVYSQFFSPSPRPGHHMFDLPAYLRQRLVGAGVMHFEDLNLDTYTGNFFSRRRSVAQKHEYDKKANLSTIALL